MEMFRRPYLEIFPTLGLQKWPIATPQKYYTVLMDFVLHEPPLCFRS